MPFHPVRLLFASNFRLGQPLRTSVPLTATAREIAFQATFRAWEQIQIEAVDRAVDLLILNGNTLVAHETPLAAEVALAEGIATLHEHGIRVAIVPGDDDPADFWDRFSTHEFQIVNLTDNRIETIHSTDGTPLCRIGGLSEQRHDPADHSEHKLHRLAASTREDVQQLRQLPPGVSLCLSGGTASWSNSHSDQLSHKSCAAPQTLSETNEADGCLLVELHHDRRIDVARIETASVRFHSQALALDPQMSWDDVTLLMQSHLEEDTWAAHERLKLVRWLVEGDCELARSLCDGSITDELLAYWERDFAPDDERLILHEFELGEPTFPAHFSNAHPAAQLVHNMTAETASLPQEEWQESLSVGCGQSLHEHSLWPILSQQLDPARIRRESASVAYQWLNETTQKDP